MSHLQRLAEEATQNAELEKNDTPPEQENETPAEPPASEPQEPQTPTDPVTPEPPADEAPAQEPKPQDSPADQPEEPKNKTSRFANEELKKFNDFVLKTGKSWEDFQAFNKPTSELDSKELLRQYFSEKEGMSEKEINYELNRLVVEESELDLDFEDEDEKLKREISLERELRKASEWREGYVQEINTTLENTDTETELSVEDYQNQLLENQKKSVTEYRETVYGAIADAKPIELDVNGEKVKFVPDEDYLKNLKTVAEDFGVATNEYFDETGKLTNADGWLDLVGWAHKPTREAKINLIVEQAILRDRVEQSKERRNVTPENSQSQSANTPDSDKDFKEWRGRNKKPAFGM